MAFDLGSITSGPRQQPPLLFLYGPHGVGKTTFGCSARSHRHSNRGMVWVHWKRLPSHRPRTCDDVIEAIYSLYQEEHSFKTVVLDSADWLDNLIQRQVRENHDEKPWPTARTRCWSPSVGARCWTVSTPCAPTRA